jgi:hypothetical protein
MKAASLAVSAVSLGFFLATLGGCQTDSPGVKNTFGSYSEMVNAAPDKVTKAANTSVKDMKLLDIVSNGTKVDGRVTAKDAQNDLVTIDIEQAGENVSKVSIRVGSTGDEAVSKQILERIKKNL